MLRTIETAPDLADWRKINRKPSWLISGASIEASSRDNLEAVGDISSRHKLRKSNTKSNLATVKTEGKLPTCDLPENGRRSPNHARHCSDDSTSRLAQSRVDGNKSSLLVPGSGDGDASLLSCRGGRSGPVV